MFLRTNTKFEPGSVKRSFCRFIWTVCMTWPISLPSDIMKWNKKKTSTLGREYSKTTKNHLKLIRKRIRKALYLAQYTKIGKVIKRCRDLDRWQFVLKLSEHLSFIILNLCTMLTFDLLNKSMTCRLLCSSSVGIWRKIFYWKKFIDMAIMYGKKEGSFSVSHI